MEPAFGDRFAPNPAFARMKQKGWLGQKSGTGFYRHRGKKKKVNPEVAALVADDERNDREAAGAAVAQDLDVRVRLPAFDRPLDERFLAFADGLHAHGLLQVEHEAGPDGLDACRRAGPLARATARSRLAMTSGNSR